MDSGTIDDGGVKIHLPSIGDNYEPSDNTFSQPMPSPQVSIPLFIILLFLYFFLIPLLDSSQHKEMIIFNLILMASKISSPLTLLDRFVFDCYFVVVIDFCFVLYSDSINPSQLLNNGSQQASSFLNFYAHIDWIRPHFDVSPGEVGRRFFFLSISFSSSFFQPLLFSSYSPSFPPTLSRLFGAFVPGWRKDFGEGNADLYGPTMIVFTLISILVFTMKGNSARTVSFFLFFNLEPRKCVLCVKNHNYSLLFLNPLPFTPLSLYPSFPFPLSLLFSE